MVVQLDLQSSLLDVGHFGGFLSQLFEQAVFARLEAQGFGGLARSHGYVVQRLIDGSRSVSAIARDLDVSQQVVSKWAAELTELGLVEPAPGEDKRERRVQLSKRGKQCLRVSREARAKLSRKLEAQVGVKALARLRDELIEAVGALGGLDAIRARRVRPPR